MNARKEITGTLIAPCGMNCGICFGYLRPKNPCLGCNQDSAEKTRQCSIKRCRQPGREKARFCYACTAYPCRRLRQLDERYRRKYGMSMIANLDLIKTKGIRFFVAREKVRWVCQACGSRICVHRPECPGCGAKRAE